MTSNFANQLMEYRLSLPTLAQDLKEDGRLRDEDLARINLSSKLGMHPLVFLAEQRLPDAAAPGKRLTMEQLRVRRA